MNTEIQVPSFHFLFSAKIQEIHPVPNVMGPVPLFNQDDVGAGVSSELANFETFPAFQQVSEQDVQ